MSVEPDQMLLLNEFSDAELAQVGITAGVGSPGYTGDINAAREAAFARSQMPGQGGLLGSATEAFVFAGLAAGGMIGAGGFGAIADIPGLSGPVEIGGAIAAAAAASQSPPPTLGTPPELPARALPTVPPVVLPDTPGPPSQDLPGQAGIAGQVQTSIPSGFSLAGLGGGLLTKKQLRNLKAIGRRLIGKGVSSLFPKAPKVAKKMGTKAAKTVGRTAAQRLYAMGAAAVDAPLSSSKALVKVVPDLVRFGPWRFLGPVGALFGAGELGIEVGKYVRRRTDAAPKRPALEPIKVTAKQLPGGQVFRMPVPGRDVYEMPRAIPPFKPIQPAVNNRRGLNPKTLAKVQKIGGILDALKKANKKPAGAALAAIAPTALTAIQPTVLPSWTPQYFLQPSARTPQREEKCSCKKKRGPARKCLQRVQVVFKSGPRKGQTAGTKCIRYAN